MENDMPEVIYAYETTVANKWTTNEADAERYTRYIRADLLNTRAILNETPPIVSDEKLYLTNNPATSDAAVCSGTNADLKQQDEPQDAAVRGDLIDHTELELDQKYSTPFRGWMFVRRQNGQIEHVKTAETLLNELSLLREAFEVLIFSRGYMDGIRVADDNLNAVNDIIAKLKQALGE
jgi:hypothetical protein